jgi:hypothetical protein
MIYRTADLDYIYVRIGSKDKTLNEMTDSEFVDWATERFGIEIKDDMNAQNTPWTPQQKVDFLNDMVKRNEGNPVVVMIKREARDEFDRGNKNE